VGRCNYDTLSPSERSNAGRMHRRFSDEAIVVVKLSAVENMVTYLRIKHSESAVR